MYQISICDDDKSFLASCGALVEELLTDEGLTAGGGLSGGDLFPAGAFAG